MKEAHCNSQRKKNTHTRMPVRKFTVSPSVVRSLESVSKWIFLSNHECSRTLLFFSFACKFREEKKFRCSFSHSFQNCAALFLYVLIPKSFSWNFRRACALCFKAMANIVCISHVCNRRSLNFTDEKSSKHTIYARISHALKNTHTHQVFSFTKANWKEDVFFSVFSKWNRR